MTAHLCIVTTAHPLDDVRVRSKIVDSFLALGYKVSWVGPELYMFSSGNRDERISYHLTPTIRRKFDRFTSVRHVARRAREVQGVDWYYSPDPDAVPISLRLARRSEAKVVFDIHEIYDGALLDRWLLGRASPFMRRLVHQSIARTCRKSDVTIAVSRAVLDHYAPNLENGLVLRNCAPRWFAGPLGESETTSKDNEVMRVMHGKALSNNGTSAILRAIAALPRESPVRVVMFPQSLYRDTLPPEFEALANRLDVRSRLDTPRRVEHAKMPSLVASCDVGMIAYGRDLGKDSLPNRLFEYMAAGVAVLAPSYSSEIAQIVESEEIGLTAEMEDPDAIARALTWFADNPDETRAMGKRAREAFLDRHTWEDEFRKLLRVL